MLAEGIYYQTKRGVKPPKGLNSYQKTDLAKVGKLYLAAFFQMPGTSRSKPSELYTPKYYDKIFLNDSQNRKKIAQIYRDLLYINDFYTTGFLNRFEAEGKYKSLADETLSFAKNARTLCIAFVMLASRYYYNSLSGADLKQLFDALDDNEELKPSNVYNIFTKNFDSLKRIFPDKLYRDKDKYDEVLYRLFKCIINSGAKSYRMELKHDKTLNATNYLKKDRNYYTILSFNWDDLEEHIKKIFSEVEGN